ncbi:hypothetical protein [Haloarcula rubra]|nr:hypothetical protein [Halomicroarcula rubra]
MHIQTVGDVLATAYVARSPSLRSPPAVADVEYDDWRIERSRDGP